MPHGKLLLVFLLFLKVGMDKGDCCPGSPILMLPVLWVPPGIFSFLETWSSQTGPGYMKRDTHLLLNLNLPDFIHSLIWFHLHQYIHYNFIHLKIVWTYVCAQPCDLNHCLCDPMDCRPPGSSVHGFSRQEYWSALPFPPPGDLPNPRIECRSPVSPVLGGGFFTTESPGKPCVS